MIPGSRNVARRTGGGLRLTAWGTALIGVYLGAVLLTSRALPVRIIYDGQAPPTQYNWVTPPPYLASTNARPSSGAATVPVGLQPSSVTTEDGQAIVIFPEGVIAFRTGEVSANVTITPLDPTTVAPAPQGRRFDGNAYRIEARYAGSRQPIELRGAATVILRFPIVATTLLRLADAQWIAVPAEKVLSTLQIFAPTDKLDVFVAASPATAGPGGLPLITWWAYTTVTAALVLAIAAFLHSLRRGGPSTMGA